MQRLQNRENYMSFIDKPLNAKWYLPNEPGKLPTFSSNFDILNLRSFRLTSAISPE